MSRGRELLDAGASYYPLHRLASQLRNAVIAGVVVQHNEPGSFSTGSYQQIRQRNGAALRLAGKQGLHIHGPVHGGIGYRHTGHASQQMG